MRMRISAVLATLLFVGAAPAAAQVVRTAQGRVEGVRAEGVSSFLGLPYAAAPLRDLRWRAPAPFGAATN